MKVFSRFAMVRVAAMGSVILRQRRRREERTLFRRRC
jgi:hypothetical protein